MRQASKFLALSVLVSSVVWAQSEDRWPGSPRFGLRTGLTGSTATPGIDVGNVGIKTLLNDQVGLTVDLGLGISAGSNASAASFALGAGMLLYLQDTNRSLRPYIPVNLSFGVVSASASTSTAFGNFSSSSSTFQLAVSGGLGAEYFFSRQFSLSGEVVLKFHFRSFDPMLLNISTFAPGVHATYYF